MEALEKKLGIASDTRTLRKFGITMGVVFGLIAALSFHKDWAWKYNWMWIAIGFAVPGLLFPRLLRPINALWMTLAHMMGFVMSRIILSVFYFGLILPMGLVMRTFGENILRSSPGETHWQDKPNREPDPESYENQF